MTTRYVGIGGSDANSGLTWALRKLTLNGCEDTPVVAGDTIFVGPGTYRELLIVDVSGTAGNPITYIGDYTGANTDGIGGMVRITGSANDIALTRANCITVTSKNYRTFTGFMLDLTSNVMADIISSTDVVFNKCIFFYGVTALLRATGLTQARMTVQNCAFFASRGVACVQFSHSAVVDNAAHLVENCLFVGGGNSKNVDHVRVGGTTVINSTFLAGGNGVQVTTAITVGQIVTVNNCTFQSCTAGLIATVSGEIVENYNTLFGNGTDRTNTATGANSIAYPSSFDSRWFFQMVNVGAGPNNVYQLATPFDLASFSALLNVAGTSPSTTDMRGTAIQGSQREWGALEYDSTLKIQGSAGGSGTSRKVQT